MDSEFLCVLCLSNEMAHIEFRMPQHSIQLIQNAGKKTDKNWTIQ